MVASRSSVDLPGPAARRVRRELRTIHVMIGMYCRAHHASGADLCDDCAALWDYARARVDRCPFKLDKPTCVRCPVHCYKPDRRERIRQVMRFAGPRMLWRHPLLTVLHLRDGRRSPPQRAPCRPRPGPPASADPST